MIIKEYLDISQSVYIEYDDTTKELNMNDTIFFMKEPFITNIKKFIEVIENAHNNV